MAQTRAGDMAIHKRQFLLVILLYQMKDIKLPSDVRNEALVSFSTFRDVIRTLVKKK